MKKYGVLALAALILSIGFVAYQSTHAKGALAQDDLDKSIAKTEARLAQGSPSVDDLLALSLAYLQKVRETADSSYYLKVDELIAKATSLEPNNPDVPYVEAVVAGGRHQFQKALERAEKAIAISPNTARYYGILSDAQVELGKYDKAALSLQKMVDLRPDFSSYSRISHIRELHGDIAGAIEAMNTAITSGAAFKENVAWAQVELGKLYFPTDLERAAGACNQAHDTLLHFAPADECLGKIAAAQEKVDGAESSFKEAYEAIPIAQYATDLADIYELKGNTTSRNQELALAQIAYETGAKNGVRTELELANMLSDHDLDPPTALKKAVQAEKDRPSIDGEDALAWALYKNGKAAEALPHSDASLRLGTKSALLHFHRALIEKALGNTREAQKEASTALALNPHFSLIYTKAAEELAR